jgi:hypothetical protein
MDIIFTPSIDVSEDLYPQPAPKMLPDWYKQTDSYWTKEKKPTMQNDFPETIKKCLPVFDAITSGYIIKTVADIFITKRPEETFYSWSGPFENNQNPIEFHHLRQAPLHPLNNGENYPKWNNPWAIKTPPGYSCLFITPLHRDLPFTILPGIVDTDRFIHNVNFPFVMTDKNFEGLIPIGTPMVQVIPFKRDSWEMKLGNDKDKRERDRYFNFMFRKIYDRYKTMGWNKKEFK